MATVVLAGCAASSGDADQPTKNSSAAAVDSSSVTSRVTQLLGAVDAVLGTSGPAPSIELNASDPALVGTGLAAAAVTAEGSPARLIINPDLITGADPRRLDALLAHELVHVRMQPVTNTGATLWIVEGFADLVGFQVAGVAAEQLYDVAAYGPSPTSRPSDAAFASEGAAQQAAYAQAFLLWRVIADRVGVAGCVQIYSDSAGQADPAVFDQAVFQATGLSPVQVNAAWIASIEKGSG